MQKVLTVGPNNGARIYKSLSSTSRVLSGTGSTTLRHSVADQCNSGGGFVGEVWVQYTTMPAGIKRK